MLIFTRPVTRATIGLLPGPRTRLRQWSFACTVDALTLEPDTVAGVGVLLDKAVGRFLAENAIAVPAALGDLLAEVCASAKASLAAPWATDAPLADKEALATARWGWVESSVLSEGVDLSGLSAGESLYGPLSRWAAALAHGAWHSGAYFSPLAAGSFAVVAPADGPDAGDPVDELVTLVDTLWQYRSDPVLQLPCEALAAAGVTRGVAHQIAGATKRISVGSLDLLNFGLPRFDIGRGSALRQGFIQAAALLMNTPVQGQPDSYFHAATQFATSLADSVLKEAQALTFLQLFTMPRVPAKELAVTAALHAPRAMLEALCAELEVASQYVTTTPWVGETSVSQCRDLLQNARGIIATQATFLDPTRDWYKDIALYKGVFQNVPDFQGPSALFFMTLLVWERYGYPQPKLESMLPAGGPLTAYQLKVQSLVHPARDAFLDQTHQKFKDLMAKKGLDVDKVVQGKDIVLKPDILDKLGKGGHGGAIDMGKP